MNLEIEKDELEFLFTILNSEIMIPLKAVDVAARTKKTLSDCLIKEKRDKK